MAARIQRDANIEHRLAGLKAHSRPPAGSISAGAFAVPFTSVRAGGALCGGISGGFIFGTRLELDPELEVCFWLWPGVCWLLWLAVC